MTQQEFNKEYVIGKINPRTNEYIDFMYFQYACEAWDCMTDEERKFCTPEMMNRYIQDTYDYINNEYLNVYDFI